MATKFYYLGFGPFGDAIVGDAAGINLVSNAVDTSYNIVSGFGIDIVRSVIVIYNTFPVGTPPVKIYVSGYDLSSYPTNLQAGNDFYGYSIVIKSFYSNENYGTNNGSNVIIQPNTLDVNSLRGWFKFTNYVTSAFHNDYRSLIYLDNIRGALTGIEITSIGIEIDNLSTKPTHDYTGWLCSKSSDVLGISVIFNNCTLNVLDTCTIGGGQKFNGGICGGCQSAAGFVVNGITTDSSNIIIVDDAFALTIPQSSYIGVTISGINIPTNTIITGATRSNNILSFTMSNPSLNTPTLTTIHLTSNNISLDSSGNFTFTYAVSGLNVGQMGDMLTNLEEKFKKFSGTKPV